MASKRRGILYLAAGLVAAGAKFGDEAATLLARGSDEVIEAGSKSGDEAARGGDESGSALDDAVNKGKRTVRQHRIKSAIANESVTETFEIPTDYYAGFEARPSQRAELSYEFEVTGDANIDVFLLDTIEFERYTNGDSVGSLSSEDILLQSAGTQTTELEPLSTRYLIFDNTAVPLAEAGKQVSVTATVTLSLV
ncbi:hypothetical protein ACOZ4N_00070 (plasmid) [Halorientalis pallida]|uniref:hypothetical protein n=1 Tax=Halorientalis pallida TaxID=2479928 RepID=UPI003C6EF16E